MINGNKLKTKINQIVKEDLKQDFNIEDDKQEKNKTFVASELGARRMASLRSVISNKELWVCYIGLFLITFVNSLESNFNYSLFNIALEEFKANAILSVFGVVTSLLGIILVPLYSKFTDYFGRTEIYLFSLLCHLLGVVFLGVANSFSFFFAGYFLSNIGFIGFNITKKIIVADLTSLANRAMFSSIDMIPFVLNNWLGTLLATPVSVNLGWRWGYIVSAAIFIPCISLFFGMMFYLQRKAKKQTNTFVSIKQFGLSTGLKNIYQELDLVGFTLLVAGLLTLLIPFNIAATLENGWGSPSMIALIIIGVVLLIGLIVWESKYAKAPLIPLSIFKNRTVSGAILVICLISLDSGINWQYLYLYFMTSRKLDPTSASLLFKGYQTGYLISALITGFLIKKLHNYKYLLIAGAALNCIGLGAMIPARFPHSSDLSIHVTQALSGIGQGIVDIGIAVAYQGSVDRKDIAITVSTIQIIQGIVSAFGNTIAGVVWVQVVPMLIKQRVEGEIDMTGAMNQMKYVWELPSNQFDQVISSYGDVQMIFSALSCALAGLALVIIIFMINPVNVHTTQKFDGKITEKHED
ncbi:MFS general substrate transporter [Neoconidiobolus thromboides FSU 785]|nr:MFS general substrate transporter [Neoconidiobolus thromboides FSU 785]